MKKLLLVLSFTILSHISVFAQTNETIRVTILHVNDVYQFIPVEGGALEELLQPKIYDFGEFNLDWWLYSKKKVEIPGASEAVEAVYNDVKGNFDSTSPYEIKVVVANFPTAEAARAYFRERALSGAKEDNISEPVTVGEREIGRAVTKGSRVFWTSGSIYCETNPRFLPDGFIQKMLAR